MNIRLFLFPLLLVFGLLFVSCSSTSESPYVEIQTTEGTFVVQLYKETPLHRDHFLSLVKEGFYDELLFHRVERGYLMQAGDPNSRNASHNRILGTDNGGETIPAEIDTTLSRQEQSSERLNRKGALTAARLPDEVNPLPFLTLLSFLHHRRTPVHANGIGFTGTCLQRQPIGHYLAETHHGEPWTH